MVILHLKSENEFQFGL